MHQRAADIQRKLDAEASWRQTLKGMGTFFKKKR
jgi:hypothetical protein